MRYAFENCLLDPIRHEFRVDGVLVDLEPQVFALLQLLAGNPGALITRDELIETIWNGRIVSESTIAARINAARRAVGDDGTAQRVIKTVPRLGIKMVADVTVAEDDVAAGASAENLPAPSAGAAQHVRFAASPDGVNIAYATTGNGPDLLRAGHWLTHLELDWASPVWRPLLNALGDSFTLTRYDQRGTGVSDRSAKNFSLENFVDDLEAVADAAGLERFPIFASSQGVPIAIAFAARRPDRVSRLILYGGFAAGRRHRDSVDEAARSDAFLTMIREGWGRYGSAFMTAFSTVYMPDASQEQLESMAEMQLASATPETAVRLRQAIDVMNVGDLLEGITAPTLVIHAREDAIYPLDEGRKLASAIPGAEFLVLESRNHVLLPQHATCQKVVGAIAGFAKD